MDVKKILAVVGFIILVLGLGFALYWVFFRADPVPDQDVNFVPGDIPGIGIGNISFVDDNTNQPTDTLPW
ncbi:hypothetical protein K8R42_04455 [bacterium]|nr:hypothetical protein [bacterium]